MSTTRAQIIMDNVLIAINADNQEQSIAHREEAAREIGQLEAELAEALKYKDTIDQSLVVAHLGVANGDPVKELHQLIQWEIGVHEYFELEQAKAQLAAAKELLLECFKSWDYFDHELNSYGQGRGSRDLYGLCVTHRVKINEIMTIKHGETAKAAVEAAIQERVKQQ